MKTSRQLTAIIEREDDAFVALCPQLDIASQGDTVEAARRNLVEALELFFESADPAEVARRLGVRRRVDTRQARGPRAERAIVFTFNDHGRVLRHSPASFRITTGISQGRNEAFH